MRMIMLNGPLFCLIFMWTSLATGSASGLGDGVVVNASRVGIQVRRQACRNLGGRCVKRRRDCPDNVPLETEPGKPYCKRKRRCCYPEQSRCGIQNRFAQCVQYNGDPGVLKCGKHLINGALPAYAWCYIDQKGTRRDCGDVPCTNRKDWNLKPCVRHNGVAARCGHHTINFNGAQINPTYAWCYAEKNNNVWGYCTEPCKFAPGRFTGFHVCQGCDSDEETLVWVKKNRKNIPKTERNTVFSNIPGNIIAYRWSTFDNPQYKEDTCQITAPVRTWLCKAISGSEGPFWNKCVDKGLCTGIYAVYNGHFLVDSRKCNKI